MSERDLPATTRLTVNLVPESVVAMNAASEREGINRTDVVNRALQVYALITAYQDVGAELYLRTPEPSKFGRKRYKTERVTIQ